MDIKIQNVTSGYDKTPIVKAITTSIPDKKITMLIGPNGCGKSTLLKTIAGILPPMQGTIQLQGRDLQTLSRKTIAKHMAFLPQSPIVPEGIRVSELVAYGRYPHQKPLRPLQQSDYDIIAWAMAKTGVDGLADAYVQRLSGGQRQRVWIAMALAQRSEILLLDEPTTYLDIAHQLEVLSLLEEIHTQQQTTIVVVIHELNLAAKYGHHILAMRDGRLLQEGSPHKVMTQATLRELYDIEARLYEGNSSYPIFLEATLQKPTI